MNICILDAKTLGTDMDLDGFRKFGQVSIYETTSPEKVVERIKDQEIIVTNKVLLHEANLKQAPKVRLICLAATGVNNVDLEYVRKHGIAVTNVAGYSTDSVVQHTFALLFYLLESLPYYDRYVKSGQYAQSDIFTHLEEPFWELHGKTWGIIGLGTIGKKVAEVAQAFGCKAIYYSTSGQHDDPNYQRISLDELLLLSDIVSIHAPLNENTTNLITYEELKIMRQHALLLNLGRGGIVNETDLARALNEDLIAGAGLDVLENEPITSNNPLLNINKPEKLLITPHIAWATVEARTRLVNEMVLNIESFVQGERRNRVDW